MKKIFAAAFAAFSLWILQVSAFASPEDASASGGISLASAGRFFAGFLLVMGIIFLALLFTTWIGKKWGKH